MTNMLKLIILLFFILIGNALAAENGTNTSKIEKAADSVVIKKDTIKINENATIIKITKNSTEAAVEESIIKEEQNKSSEGFSLNENSISSIIKIVIIMSIVGIAFINVSKYKKGKVL